MKFNTNVPFWQFMNTLARFTALNLVYLVTLIPIITILYAVALASIIAVTLATKGKSANALSSR